MIKKILLILLIMPVLSFAKPIVDSNTKLNLAVNQVMHIYKQTGLVGVKSKIERCYHSSHSDKLYCLYLDYTARIIDTMLSAEMRFPLDEYFEDNAFGSRIMSEVYMPLHVTKKEANRHLISLYDKIIKRLANFKKY